MATKWVRPEHSHEAEDEASLATETGVSAVGASRLKGGCSQDWLPHKAAEPQPNGRGIWQQADFANRPQVLATCPT